MCVSVPLNALSLLLVPLILVFILFPAVERKISLWALVAITFSGFPVFGWVLTIVGNLFSFAKRNRTLILTTPSLIWRAKTKDISIVWPRVLKVLLWSNDVLVVTFASLIFVPREAFSSRDEAQEFARIARELCQSNGKSWRPEWNETFFGASAETAPPNLPK